MFTSLDTQPDPTSDAADRGESTSPAPHRDAGVSIGPRSAAPAPARCPVLHPIANGPNGPSGPSSAVASSSGWMPRDLRRWTLAAVGVFATSLAIVGAILPGMPSTIFVIVAAWCFTRSCPVLEEKLLRNRLLRPSMEIVDGTRPFTRRARIATVATMTAFASTSVALLAWSDRLSTATFWLIAGLVAIGAVAIALYRPTSARR